MHRRPKLPWFRNDWGSRETRPTENVWDGSRTAVNWKRNKALLILDDREPDGICYYARNA